MGNQSKLQVGVRRFSALLVFSVALVANLPVRAQTVNGTVLGGVTDASGSAIPGAMVTLTNPSTGDHRTAQTDGSGNYRFLNMVPGTYRLEIEKAGFRRQTRDEVVLNVAADMRVDVRLDVGDVSQTVEVAAETPLVQTDSAALSQVVEGRTVTDTPLNGRNVLNLVTLVPGVVAIGNSFSGNPMGNASTNPSSNYGWGMFASGGGSGNQNAMFVDGLPQNTTDTNRTVLVPTQDAIQEFRIATNNVSAEFGRFAGAVVNMTTKSGSNQFHGSGYEFLRNKDLNANNFFNNATNLPRPSFTQNQAGGNIGGPIVKDKTFFFFTWEGFWLRQGSPLLTTVPTAAMRVGNFAGLPTIYDPTTNPRVPFNNNQLTRLDPTAVIMANLYFPLPNLPGNINNFSSNVNTGGNSNQYDVRIDHTISDKQRLFARYTYWNNNALPFNPFNNITVQAPTDTGINQFVGGDTYALNPTTVFDFRLGTSIHAFYNTAPPGAANNVNEGQFGPAYAALSPQMSYHVIPSVSITGFYPIVSNESQGINNDYYSLFSMTKVLGRHTIKIGGQVQREEFYLGQGRNGVGSGVFNFDNTFTQAGATTRTGGYPFASFMLGYATTGQIQTVNRSSMVDYYQGYYLTDTFQVSRKLTLTLGLRWELPGVYAEKHDRNTNFDPTAPNPLAAQTGLPLLGQFQLVNSSQYPSRFALSPRYDLFAPRVGLAYRIDDKTVIRAGYGISYEPAAQSMTNNSPINATITTLIQSLDGNVTPYNVLSNPYPNGIQAPSGRNPGAPYNLGTNGTAFNYATFPDYSYPYIQQWNFNIQRQLPGGSVFQVAYAASKGTHLPGAGSNIDQLNPVYFSLGSQLTTQVPNPFAGLMPSTSTLNASTILAGQLLRPYPQYLFASASGTYLGTSSYNSLQVTLQKRFGGGGNFSASYVWSKFITDVEGQEPSGVQNTVNAIQTSYCLNCSQALSGYDVAQHLVLSYTYDLPFGKGKHFLSGVSPLADRFVGGWGFNGITTIQSGFPLSISSAASSQLAQFGYNTANTNTAQLYPNVTAGCDKTIPGPLSSHLNQAFNTACFSAPSPFGFGDEARTDPNLRGQGIDNWDVSLFKNITVTERVRMQFRAEVFNVANRVQFAPPATSFGSATFGIISSQANNPRLIQFALRLNF